MYWKKKLVYSILAVVCLSNFVSVPDETEVFAETVNQGLAISPAILEVEAEAGKKYDLDYVVENNTGIDNLQVQVSIETFQEGSLPGSANVVPFEETQSFAYWLTVNNQMTLKQGQRQKTTYQLGVPDNTKPGAYFFAIVYQPQQQENTSSGNALFLKTRLATLLFVNVGGDSSKQPTIEDFSLGGAYWVDPFFDRVDLSYKVAVKGSSFYRPTGNLFLTDSSSESIQNLTSLTSDRIILPGGKRAYQYCIKQSGWWAPQCVGENTTTSLPMIGSRTLALRLDFSDGLGKPQTVVAEKQIFFFPYKLAILILVFFLTWYLLYQLLVFLRKRVSKKQMYE